MKKNTRFLLLLIGISLLSCNNTMKKSITPISSFSTDFPITERLKFDFFNKYNILERGFCVIDDSILWHFKNGRHDFGSCYDLNTRKKLSVIAYRGTSTNELSNLDWFNIIGDSLLFYVGQNTIKTCSKKDIINNVPIENRTFSVITAPDSILVSQMTKLPNGSALVTIRPAINKFEKEKRNEINKKTIAIFNNNKIKSYETIKYDSFDVEEATKNQIDANDLIKWTYAQGIIAIKDNNTAVFSAFNQFILYTFDLNIGNVSNEKRYTKILRDGEEMSFTSTNDMLLNIRSIKVNDKYILCQVYGYFSEEDKEVKLQKEAIFVFDWNLNPIKKFDLPETERKDGYYTISNDCNSAYFCESNDGGITLHKADLNI